MQDFSLEGIAPHSGTCQPLTDQTQKWQPTPLVRRAAVLFCFPCPCGGVKLGLCSLRIGNVQCGLIDKGTRSNFLFMYFSRLLMKKNHCDRLKLEKLY